ncbi:amino acid adenylation domain-containing protein [Micromonospora chersina]|uniref:amino acid adenylation domain-containing protein n=1 Tax=Micromonospora chersina TaxID=47854 RepID=UPI00371E2B43
MSDLSFAQQRLWFMAGVAPGSAEDIVTAEVDLGRDVSPEAVAASLTALFTRHEILRTRFATGLDGLPYRIVDPPAPVTPELLRCDSEADARAVIAAGAEIPFDLATDRLIRVRLLCLPEDRLILVAHAHRIVFDERSAVVFRAEITAVTTGPPPLQYADVAAAERDQLTPAVLDEQLAYWRAQLADPPVLQLPTDRPRPPVRSPAGAEIAFRVPESSPGLMLAAYAVLLHRYTGQDDLLIGVPVANRNLPGTERLIGPIADTLVLRVRLDDDPTVAELLHRIETTIDEFRPVPFDRLVGELVRERDRSRTPLIQTLFDHDDDLHGDPAEGERPAVARFELSLHAGRSQVRLRYATSLFDAARIRRMAGHFTTLLAGLAPGLSEPISRLPMLTPAELAERTAWNDTATMVPAIGGVHELFHHDRDAVAVVSEDGVLTYGQLHDRANQLAHHLRASGVGPESLVAICMDSGPDTLIAILGIWKAGAAYLPLDPEHPANRIAFMVTDSGAQLLISSLADPAITACPTSEPAVTVHPDQAAYVIYTSGSTGRPKGVVATHRGLVNYAATVPARIRVGAGRHALLQPATTDFGNTMILAALVSGGSLHLPKPGSITDPDLVAAFLEDLDYLKIVPTHLADLWCGRPILPGRTLVLGGERTPPELAASLRAAPVSVINHYGPTEATIGATTHDGPFTGDVIGRPIANVRTYVLDRNLNPAPVGVPGELFIAGAGITRGYLNRAALTAERFVPAADGSRMYRTGDLAQFTGDGTLRYLGRADHQVKIRGHRVEPAEIANVLTGHHLISAAAVIPHEDRLVAYVVGDLPPTDELRAYLRTSLPDHMIPAFFVALPDLPRTANGKLNRAALPLPDHDRPGLSGDYRPPETETERALTAIWQELLGIDRIGVTDDFFDLGGHSLLAIRIVLRIRAAFGTELTMAALFDHRTVRELATVVTTEEEYEELEF